MREELVVGAERERVRIRVTIWILSDEIRGLARSMSLRALALDKCKDYYLHHSGSFKGPETWTRKPWAMASQHAF